MNYFEKINNKTEVIYLMPLGHKEAEQKIRSLCVPSTSASATPFCHSGSPSGYSHCSSGTLGTTVVLGS